jgi:spore maturation protein SpmB
MLNAVRSAAGGMGFKTVIELIGVAREMVALALSRGLSVSTSVTLPLQAAARVRQSRTA